MSNIGKYLQRRFGAKLKNGNWRFNCPFCSDERERFGVEPEKGVVHCFKCDYSNTIRGFIYDVWKMLGKEMNETMAGIGGVELDVALDSMWPVDRMMPEAVRAREITKIIPGFKPLSKRTNNVSSAFNYLVRNRRLSEADIRFWMLGTCELPEYTPFIIIPFLDEWEKVYYFVARRYFGTVEPKYKNPPKGMFNIGKASLMFNSYQASHYPTIVICEGVFDAMAVGPNAVALLGKSLSRAQLMMISRMHKSKRVVVYLDGDAESQAWDIAKQIQSIGDKDVRIVIPRAGDSSDPGDRSHRLNQTLIASATRYSLEIHLSRTTARS